ncbi:hypothetical protein NKR23_g8584 [Pleurostoma richardsiae]|uniref:Uncharacterized protein n=1 Tax=Pleurostoma richardsiae TaxID=41990 RepID=A0AA38RIC4_9PEZI|nr:hypothetical protein NKR23_g8584 [Pleurostoma richardsiae]
MLLVNPGENKEKRREQKFRTHHLSRGGRCRKTACTVFFSGAGVGLASFRVCCPPIGHVHIPHQLLHASGFDLKFVRHPPPQTLRLSLR